MDLAVVSDTHGHVEFARRAALVIEPFEPAAVIHCGDIGTPAIVDVFARWPAHYVFGNTDGQLGQLRQAMTVVGAVCHERFGELELAGRRIAFLHGDDGPRLSEAIACGRYDLVCHGHTHVARRDQLGNTLVLNPGALFRANPHSLAIVRLGELAAEIIAI